MLKCFLALSFSLTALGLQNFPLYAQTSIPLRQRDAENSLRQSSTVDEVLNSGYVLGPGDRINISVFGHEEYTGTQEILPDGTITLPIIGSIYASGNTLPSLAAELTAQLEPWLVEPVVTVSLNGQRPLIVNITGAVRRPGPTRLPENSSSLSAAMTAVGGVARDANIQEVVVVRTMPGGSRESITIDLWSTIWSEGLANETRSEVNPAQQLVLRSGDEIFVPQLAEGDVLDQRLISRSSLAPNTVRVRVVGEVRRPGEIEIPPDSTLSGAIASAGGPTDDAVLERVEFIRLNELGEVEQQEVDLRSLADQVQIQDGDVLFVPKSGIASFADITGRVLFPFSAILNIFNNANNLLN